MARKKTKDLYFRNTKTHDKLRKIMDVEDYRYGLDVTEMFPDVDPGRLEEIIGELQYEFRQEWAGCLPWVDYSQPGEEYP
jgi:hypothetical protein